MCRLAVMLLCVRILFSATIADEGLPGIILEIDGNGSRYVTMPSGTPSQSLYETRFVESTRAEVLWVDRAHQNAIAEHVSIAGYGMYIQAGWYLNNERTSCYRTLGTSTPNWTYRMSNATSYVPVDVSPHGNNILAASPGEPVYEFSCYSPTPVWTSNLPGGFTVAASAQGSAVKMSDDGSLCAVLGRLSSEGKLFIFNADGDTVRTIGFVTNSGIYGLDASADLSVLCISTYYAIYVYNLDGTRRDSIQNYGQTVAKISGDGTFLVKGDFSSMVRLYQWNGTSYGLKWQYHIGDPWVTAVAISSDGSTVMAGTYQYSPANSGKVAVFDSSSATPLWEYNQYGDYVAACAVSEDGSRCVAGSWGQYNGTYGDVVTAFDRSSSTPLLQILDDIDEPGSIFSVDISKDGSFITAGGKAVHARQMGNGGEVYSIRMLDSLNQDVGVEAINAPPIFMTLGATYTPQAVVVNYGTQTVSFNSACAIYDSLDQLLYSDTALVSDLAAGAQSTLNFSPTWTVPAHGTYSIVVTTLLAGDQFPLNDTCTQFSICYHDGAVSGIIYPFSELTLGYDKPPRADIANRGSYSENIPAQCDIYNAVGTLVYSGSAQAYLAPLQSATVTFTPPWDPADTGMHSIVCYTQLSDDYNSLNDTVWSNTDITTEIFYDDGDVNVYGIVSSNYYDNKFAEMMEPCLSPPYYIPRVRFYVNSANPIMVSLNSDSAGLPGLGPSYWIAQPETADVTASGWVVHEYMPNIQMDDSNPFWMVLHWLPDSPSAPGIGMDNTAPLDSLSYWYWTESSNYGWHIYPYYDFMMRAFTTVLPGIYADQIEQPVQFAIQGPVPNPCTRQTVIHYTIPRTGKATLKIYDITGRLVTTLVNGPVEAGTHYHVWQMIDDQERCVTSGVYFLKATFEDQVRTEKFIVLR
jgi:hypothetical protein